MDAAVYAFGEFELDESLYELRRAGRVVKLEPKVFDVLAYLVRHRDRVVSKRELLDGLWPGEAVSESVLPTNVAAARRALGESRAAQRAIQTVHGRGYRFVAAVDVRGASAPPASPAEPACATPPERRPFVGRESAMASLRDALGRARSGRGSLVLLAGEPGIGKTRTAVELAREGASRGVRVLWGRCYEGEGAPPFWPWVQVLRDATRGRDPEELARSLGAAAPDVAGLAPELREALPAYVGDEAAVREESRFRLFDGVSRMLVAAARREPTLVVLDDLHHADKPSLLLLQFLTRDLANAPLVVLGTYREVELRRSRPLAAVLAELAREPHCERIALRGLAPDDVARFLELAGAPPESALSTAVYEMTDGNPFFMGEIVELWRGEGFVPGRDGAPRVPLPQGVREAIGRRLDGLSESCNRALRCASVLGREFGIGVLERLADVPREVLLSALDEAAQARLLQPVGRGVGRMAFSHLLVLETLYDELTTPERVRLHGRAAEALEALHGPSGDAHLSELAHHLFQAAPGGDVEKAVAASVEAARRAQRVLAHEEAAAHYERALLALELAPADETRRCELLLLLGDAQDLASELQASTATFRRAMQSARTLGRADLLARAALGVRGRYDLGPPYEEGCAVLEEALEAVGDDHPVLRSRVLSRLARTPPYRDSMEARAELSQEALRLARDGGDPEALLEALAARTYPALLGPEHDDERMAVADEVEELARRTGQRLVLLHVHESRMRTYQARGDLVAAAREVDQGRRLAEAVRQPAHVYFARFFDVARAVGEGRFDDAAEEIRAMYAHGLRLSWADEHQVANVRGIYLWQVFFLLRQKGEVSKLPESARQFATAFSFPGPILEIVRAVMTLENGPADEARALYEQVAGGGLSGIVRDEWWMGTLALLAELAAHYDDAPRAAELYELLRPFAGRNVVHQLVRTYEGACDRFLGILAATRGDPDGAAHHFADAFTANERMGARSALAWSQLEYARLLLARGRRGDRGAARDVLDRCLDAARSMGAGGLAEKARELRERAA